MFDEIPYDIIGIGSPALSTYVANSDEVTQKLIAGFKMAIDQGYNPDDVKEQIFSALNVNTNDLTDFDKNRLIREVNEYYEEASL